MFLLFDLHPFVSTYSITFLRLWSSLRVERSFVMSIGARNRPHHSKNDWRFRVTFVHTFLSPLIFIYIPSAGHRNPLPSRWISRSFDSSSTDSQAKSTPDFWWLDWWTFGLVMLFLFVFWETVSGIWPFAQPFAFMPYFLSTDSERVIKECM